MQASNADLDVAISLFFENGGREAGDKDRDMQAAPTEIDSAPVAVRSINNPNTSSVARAPVTSPPTSASSSIRSIFNPPNAPSAPVVHVIHDDDSDEAELIFTPAQPTSANSGDSQPRSRQQRLADLFRPPHEIMFPGTFEMARRRAREQNRWLLVSFHEPTEFRCQAMNRDCWNDQILQDYIRENFVFVQFNAGSADATRYVNFYPFDELLPHTAIIDPRTGERVKTFLLATMPVPGFRQISGAAEMLEELVSWTGEHELEVQQVPIPVPSFVDVASVASKEQRSDAERPTSPAAAKKPKITLPAEPDASKANCTTIGFRLPDGSRLKRRFLLGAPVEEIWRVVEGICELDEGEFKLKAADGWLELAQLNEKTIEEVDGLRNSVLTIVVGEE